MKIYERNWKEIFMEQGLNSLLVGVSTFIGKSSAELLIELAKYYYHNTESYKSMKKEHESMIDSVRKKEEGRNNQLLITSQKLLEQK